MENLKVGIMERVHSHKCDDCNKGFTCDAPTCEPGDPAACDSCMEARAEYMRWATAMGYEPY